MKKREMLSAIVVIVLVGGILSACTPSPAPTPSTVPILTPSSTPTPKISQAEEGPKRGGVLRTVAFVDPPSFHPYTGTAYQIVIHAAPVFNGLLKADPQKAEVMIENIIPDLAAKWEISPDGKTYTFYLRQGVKFHDGHPFSAEDVKYSLDAYRDPKLSAFADRVEPIDNVEIVSDHTVKLNLKYPSMDLPLFLLAPFCSIMPAHLKNVDPKSTDFLVGTGPFRFKSRTVGKVYSYERNSDYFIKGLPYLNGYEIYVTNASSMVDQFVGGRLDTCGTPRQFLENRDRILKVKQMAPEAVIAMADCGITRGLQFNLKRKGPWQDVRVRNAMTLAFDYEGTIKAAVGGPEVGFIAPSGIVPYFMKEAIQQKELMTTLGLDRPIEERVVKAKQLMKEAGYADGFSAECITLDTPVTRDGMIFAADLWKRYLNIDIKVSPMEPVRLWPRRDAGEFDLFHDSASGTSIIDALGNFTTGSLKNCAKWSNEKYDELFQKILRETDPAKRVDAARAAQKIFLNELPYMVFYTNTYGTAYRPDARIGWPAVKAPVLQIGQTTLTGIDRMWFAGTPDAERWIKTQPK